MSVRHLTNGRSALYPCCADLRNREVIEVQYEEQHDLLPWWKRILGFAPPRRKNTTIQRCKVCSRRHYIGHFRPMPGVYKAG